MKFSLLLFLLFYLFIFLVFVSFDHDSLVQAQATPAAVCPSANFTSNTFDPNLYTTANVEVRITNDSVVTTTLWKRISDNAYYLPLPRRATAVSTATSWTAATAGVHPNVATCSGIETTIGMQTMDTRNLVVFFRAVRIIFRYGGPAFISTRDLTFAEMCGITNMTDVSLNWFCGKQMFGLFFNGIYGRGIGCNSCVTGAGPNGFANVDLRDTIFSVANDAILLSYSAPLTGGVTYTSNQLVNFNGDGCCAASYVKDASKGLELREWIREKKPVVTPSHAPYRLPYSGSTCTALDVAGTATAGSVDGKGSAAGLSFPNGGIPMLDGSILFADYANGLLRRIVNASVINGGVVTTLAGAGGLNYYGWADGTGTTARFAQANYFVRDPLADPTTDTYILSDYGRLRRVVVPSNYALNSAVVTTIAGQAATGTALDGTGTASRFGSAAEMAVDSWGMVYISDLSACTIRRYVPQTTVVDTFMGISGTCTTNSGSGFRTAVGLSYPRGILIDPVDDSLYVSIYNGARILRVTMEGTASTFIGTGTLGNADGHRLSATISYPAALVFDSFGDLWFTEVIGPNSAPMGKIRRMTWSNSQVTTFMGTNNYGYSATRGSVLLSNTEWLYFNPEGVLIMHDSSNNRIRVVDCLPTPSATATSSGTASFSRTATASASASTTKSAAASATASATASPSVTRTRSADLSSTPTASASTSASAVASGSSTESASGTSFPSFTSTASGSASKSSVPSTIPYVGTYSSTATSSPTIALPTLSSHPTVSSHPTLSSTKSPSSSGSASPSATATSTTTGKVTLILSDTNATTAVILVPVTFLGDITQFDGTIEALVGDDYSGGLDTSQNDGPLFALRESFADVLNVSVSNVTIVNVTICGQDIFIIPSGSTPPTCANGALSITVSVSVSSTGTTVTLQDRIDTVTTEIVTAINSVGSIQNDDGTPLFTAVPGATLLGAFIGSFWNVLSNTTNTSMLWYNSSNNGTSLWNPSISTPYLLSSDDVDPASKSQDTSAAAAADNNNSGNLALIAGLSALAVLLCCCCILFCFCRRRKKKKEKEEEKEDTENSVNDTQKSTYADDPFTNVNPMVTGEKHSFGPTTVSSSTDATMNNNTSVPSVVVQPDLTDTSTVPSSSSSKSKGLVIRKRIEVNVTTADINNSPFVSTLPSVASSDTASSSSSLPSLQTSDVSVTMDNSFSSS